MDEDISNIIATSIYIVCLGGLICGYGYWLYHMTDDDENFVSDIIN